MTRPDRNHLPLAWVLHPVSPMQSCAICLYHVPLITTFVCSSTQAQSALFRKTETDAGCLEVTMSPSQPRTSPIRPVKTPSERKLARDLLRSHRPTDAAGGLVVGWRQQADFLKAKYGGVPLWKRKPGVAWRGRTQDPEHPDRDALRWGFA